MLSSSIVVVSFFLSTFFETSLVMVRQKEKKVPRRNEPFSDLPQEPEKFPDEKGDPFPGPVPVTKDQVKKYKRDKWLRPVSVFL